MTEYRWDNPYDWLIARASSAMSSLDITWLDMSLRRLAYQTDFDTLQEIFEAEMNADGYFDPIEESDEH
jgi:hypothetical protein